MIGKWKWKIETILRHISKQLKDMKIAHTLYKHTQTAARMTSE